MTALGAARAAVLAFLAVLIVAPTAHSADRVGRTVLPGKSWSWTFDADTLGLPPASTNTKGGRWAVLEDSTASPAARILRQAESEEGIGYRFIQFLKPLLVNQEVSARIRIRSGEIDPSVGIAFQLDPKGRNGYLVRISGKDREVIAHYLLGGRRRDLKYERIEPPQTDEWHTLAVRRVGSTMEVRYDGELKLKLRDERFSKGNIGLWTEDDTVADFRDLTVKSL